VNTANARYFALELAGHELVQVGADGGLLDLPRKPSRIFLGPGERADVFVHWTGTPRSTATLSTAAHTRGHGIVTPAGELLEIRYTDEPAQQVASPVPTRLRTIEAVTPTSAEVRTFVLTEEMRMSGGSMSATFRINGQKFPEVTPVSAAPNTAETWEIVNDTEMDHLFHIHGFFFQPRALASALLPLQWRDTMNIPAGQSARIVVPFDERTGLFVFHCHILEHAEAGMMGEIEVKAP
jgi:FtsP/CotA-like multicopper oxidase with cupredoxin domain